MPKTLKHVCSNRTLEVCPVCGYEDTRDAFECLVMTPGEPKSARFAVICPGCEAEHPDQSNHDAVGCDACDEEGVYD